MRGKKNPMIMGLIGAMLLSTNAFAAVPSDFSDFPTDWSAPAMTHAVQNGLLNGSDGKILPKGLLTRAQMATMVNRAFASSAKASLTGFTDMVPGVWHYDEMAKSVQMGAFQGADGKLSPNDPITREQAFAVLARAFGLADGKASSLDKFSDGTQVSSWARGAVAALVEQGYVTGANGALNPQSYITRAEFAQVMDALVAAYADQDLKDQTVEGNLILRTNSTLENVTVKGDLILADGVSAASLKNVTVTGRLVVRGGTDGVKLTKSTAKGGIRLANPNGTPKVTVDGKAYNPNGTTNDGASNSGGGSSSGGSSGGGSSSSGGGSSSGGNSSTTQGTIVKADKTKVITTDAGTWLPLVFQDGYTSEGTTVTVDGQDVTQYVTNVTTEGTVAKLPLVAQPGTVTLTSNGKTQTIVVNQTAPATSAVYTGEHYLPEYYLAHGPVALWDYYLTNYDDSGNARVHAERTTFDTTAAKNEHPSYSPVTVLDENGDGNVVIMFNYTTDEDKAWFDGIATYDAEDSEGAVQLASYDQYKQTWNKHLSYTKGSKDHYGNTVGTLNIPFNQDNFRNNGRYYVRVASVVNGKTTYVNVPIHVVNNKAPTINITETPKSGVNLHFRVSDLVYGITDPIEKVTLTKPNGKVETLKKIDDYYLFSQDLFVLYNDTTATNGTNHLDQNGQYKLHVEATGFQDFEGTFNVSNANGGKNTMTVAMRSYSIDALSGSTSSISSGDSSSSGSYAISADLLFQSDLLANALILGDLGYANEDTPLIPAADAVLTWVQNTTFDAVFDTGDTMYFDKGDYIAASNPKTWIPFSEYRETVTANVYQPHATKEVMEDGLLGDILDASESGKFNVPDYTISGQQGENAVLTFTGNTAKDYLSKVSALYLNGDWRELSKSAYEINVEAGTITLKAEYLLEGKENSISIRSAGYKSLKVVFNYTKVNEEDLSLEVTQPEGKVTVAIKNSKGDFLKNLKSITLTKDGVVDQVYHKGYEGSDAVYYVVAEDNKSVDLYNVKPGTYTVSIEANYYTEALTTNFEVASSGDVELKPVPDSEPDVSKATNGNYQLTFSSDDNSWRNSTTITVNDVSYSKASGTVSKNQFKWVMGGYGYYLELDKTAFHTDTVSTVVITADGYQPLTLKLKSDGTLDYGENKAAPTVSTIQSETKEAYYPGDITYYKVTLTPGEGYTAQEYLNRASKFTVTVGSKTYQWKTSLSSSWDNNGFTVMDGTLALAKDEGFSTISNTTVTVEVPGYEMLTFVVDKNGNLVTGGNPGENPGGGNTGENPGEGEIVAPTVAPTIEYTQATSGNYNSYYKLTFQGDDSAWINTITAVSVDGTSYTKKDSSGELSFSQNYYLDAENSIVGITLSSDTHEVVFSVNEKTSLTLKISAPFLGTPSVTIKSTEAPGSGENGGSTGGNETPNPGAGENAVPTEVSIEKLTDTKSYRDYYALTFGSAYKEWVSSITAIKVGETAYTKVDSTDELNVQTYYLGDDGTMGIYLTGGFSDTTYQLTCITEENTTITIVVVIPSLFSDTTLSATIQ